MFFWSSTTISSNGVIIEDTYSIYLPSVIKTFSFLVKSKIPSASIFVKYLIFIGFAIIIPCKFNPAILLRIACNLSFIFYSP